MPGTDLARGAACCLEGFRLLLRPRIRRLAAAPILLSAALLAALVVFGADRFDALIDGLLDTVPGWLQWLRWLLWALFAALAVVASVLVFAVLAAALSSPFNGPLAAAVEAHLTGERPPSSTLGAALRALPRTLLDEAKKIAYAIALAIPFLVLFWIPVVNAAAPVLWFLCCAWLTAFGYCDYALSNHGLVLADIRRTLRARPLLAFGFGGAAFLALAVPVLNVLAVPAAVCGGAVLWVRELKR